MSPSSIDRAFLAVVLSLVVSLALPPFANAQSGEVPTDEEIARLAAEVGRLAAQPPGGGQGYYGSMDAACDEVSTLSGCRELFEAVERLNAARGAREAAGAQGTSTE